MRHPRTVLSSVALLVLALGLVHATFAKQTGYKVIVHPDNPVKAVDREFLGKAFLNKTAEWGNGRTIRPVDLAKSFPARERFTQEVIKKTPAQLKSYWTQRIFSGKGVPPPVVDSAADMIRYVLESPGAVGYLPSDVDPGGAKVVELQ